ncbi:MAG: thermonuclease family protein [Candidatus Thorarchaeota archaeon]
MKPIKRLLILFFVALLFFSISPTLAFSSNAYGEAIVSEVTAIYDGDTFTANIKDYPPIIGERIKIRIKGIDTPELSDRDPKVRALALKAKQYTVRRLRDSKNITLKNIQRGKYFRILADVYVDGSSLGEELIKAGLAKPYSGDKKPSWTATPVPLYKQKSQTEKDQIIVYITRTGRKYHRGNCRYLRRSKIPITLEEAKKRYGPCSVCRPPI